MKLNLFAIIISLLSALYFGCSSTSSKVELTANAGEDQNVIVGDTVELSGTASEGPGGFTYLWSYDGTVPEDSISFTGITTATPTFVVPKNGVYLFTLTISYDGETSQDMVVITAEGATEIGGTLTENLTLENIEPDPEKPDYILSEDLIIPAGITLAIGDDNVVIHAADETGIVVRGALTNAVNSEEGYEDTEFRATSGWKGILVDGGSIDLRGAEIINAGETAFDGRTEAAAVSFAGTNPSVTNFRMNHFEGSHSYDILALVDVVGRATITSNVFSFAKPFKANINFISSLTSDYPNIYPDSYDYLHFVPSPVSQGDSIPFGIYFPMGKLFIDGDLRAKSELTFSYNTNVYMKEGAGIYSEGLFSFLGGSRTPSSIDGLNGASWKGIGVGSENRVRITNVTISNAGSAPIDFGDVSTPVAAALYMDKYTGLSGEISNSTIKNSSGYGIYFNDTIKSLMITDTRFDSTAQAAVRANVQTVNQVIKATFSYGNKYILADTVPAVLVQGEGIPSFQNWASLGTDNFYLIDADLDVTEKGMTIQKGTNFRFTTGKSLVFDVPIGGTLFEALGTADEPITFDCIDGTPGSWGGIYVGGMVIFKLNHCTIANGGGALLSEATEKGNFVYNFRGGQYNDNRMTNTKIESSAGYGIVHEPFAQPFDFEEPGKSITFANNTMNDIVIVPEP